MEKKMIKCIKYKSYVKGTLLGFADIFVPKWGVEIYGLTYHQKDGKRWVNFPSREYEKDGEKKHAPYFKFPDNSNYNIFCEKVKEAIEIKIQETVGGNNNESDSTFCF